MYCMETCYKPQPLVCRPMRVFGIIVFLFLNQLNVWFIWFLSGIIFSLYIACFQQFSIQKADCWTARWLQWRLVYITAILIMTAILNGTDLQLLVLSIFDIAGEPGSPQAKQTDALKVVSVTADLINEILQDGLLVCNTIFHLHLTANSHIHRFIGLI
jgi:hypothetical protein